MLKYFHKLLMILVFGSLMSCTERRTFSLSSPDGKQCLYFNFISSLNPNEKPYVVIYLHDAKLFANQNLKLKVFKDFPINIHWGSPIKIRGGFIISNSIDSSLVDSKFDFSPEEEIELKEGTGWEGVFLSEIPEGKYRHCR